MALSDIIDEFIDTDILFTDIKKTTQLTINDQLDVIFNSTKDIYINKNINDFLILLQDYFKDNLLMGEFIEKLIKYNSITLHTSLLHLPSTSPPQAKSPPLQRRNTNPLPPIKNPTSVKYLRHSIYSIKTAYDAKLEEIDSAIRAQSKLIDTHINTSASKIINDMEITFDINIDIDTKYGDTLKSIMDEYEIPMDFIDLMQISHKYKLLLQSTRRELVQYSDILTKLTSRIKEHIKWIESMPIEMNRINSAIIRKLKYELINEFDKNDIKKAIEKYIKTTKKFIFLMSLNPQLLATNQYICGICCESKKEIILIPCGHSFCNACVKAFIPKITDNTSLIHCKICNTIIEKKYHITI